MQQVQPAFKPALAAMCPPVPTAPMQRFRVRVRTENGTFVFYAHYASSFEAAESAIERHGQHAHISVRAVA